MQHVYVLHGYSASPEDHWFQDIKNQLSFRIQLIQM
jgi:predicted alpha/beta hydrolase family esterase